MRPQSSIPLALSAVLSLCGFQTDESPVANGRYASSITQRGYNLGGLGPPSLGNAHAEVTPTVLAQSEEPAVETDESQTRYKTHDGKVELNFVNLPIAEAAKVVLSDMKGIDFVVDPRLEGRVTVHTARPVSKRQALDLFQSALRVSGAALVRTGHVYKIVPIEAAGGASADVAVAGPAQESDGLGGYSVIAPLRYVSAAEMKRVLDPIAAKGGGVRADSSRRAVVLNGSPQEIDAMREAITLFDVDAMRGMAFALVPVKSSDPSAMTEDLRTVFGSEKEGPMNGMIQFVGNKRLNAILVISPNRQYLERARAWIERLDARAQTSEKQFFTYRVQNRPAKELLQVLTAMFASETGGKIGSSSSPRQGQSVVSSANNSMFGQNGAPPTNPLGGLTSNGTPSSNPLSAAGNGQSDFQSSASSSGGSLGNGMQAAALGEDSRFRLAADDAKNALVIMASSDDYRKILRVIETLDVSPNQVFIEATIAEVTINDALHFGVESYFNRHTSYSGFSTNSATPKGEPTTPSDILGNNPLNVGTGAIFPGFSYALKTANTQVTLNALNAITTVNIVSTPSLTVLDNHQAVLQVGDQVPVASLQSATALGNTYTSVSYRDTGVILSITPHISDSGRVMLNLVQEVSNVDTNTITSTNTNPTIQQRKVSTDVVVKDGEALMLGGLMQHDHSHADNQVPVLGDIPLIGNAFKDKKDSVGKTELLIMITPHVLRSSAEALAITDEYKRQMREISSRAIKKPHSLSRTLDRAILDGE
ncbi:type II secretion system protein D (GspD) [Rhodoblastus acidophilus]|uniref:Type II secretion system protein D (GspD) n=1 Tax=Rhodoblastus acidophilus TaxID=1074 RepID=A0A212SE72_RHOAC|nr:type II secretion system secretin GspD [Rhodoblastus acidophilus]MCW2319217.1 general secretion pathway protein D [Rhodoblastus acidophilus]PPQ34991.1 type II secretion system protein GspD [Rhodoblastus acidophilus]RAI20008.1 type II secretion system protein GspD [Rhodoblastus acidophilus]SNB83924.1 type II secretion system protein D (GspD) [Rhodoblastus acidophilus]